MSFLGIDIPGFEKKLDVKETKKVLTDLSEGVRTNAEMKEVEAKLLDTLGQDDGLKQQTLEAFRAHPAYEAMQNDKIEKSRELELINQFIEDLGNQPKIAESAKAGTLAGLFATFMTSLLEKHPDIAKLLGEQKDMAKTLRGWSESKDDFWYQIAEAWDPTTEKTKKWLADTEKLFTDAKLQVPNLILAGTLESELGGKPTEGYSKVDALLKEAVKEGSAYARILAAARSGLKADEKLPLTIMDIKLQTLDAESVTLVIDALNGAETSPYKIARESLDSVRKFLSAARNISVQNKNSINAYEKPKS
jgi:hypothetical protein